MSDDKKTEHINIRVLGQDNAIVQFKIKKHTPMRKLMVAYCDRSRLAKEAVRFRFDGAPISDLDTPETLEMEEGDMIEIYQPQSGGFVEQPVCITVQVSSLLRGTFVYETMIDVPIRTLLEHFCTAKNIDWKCVEFEHNCKLIINTEKTPRQLRVKDGDIVTAIAVGRRYSVSFNSNHGGKLCPKFRLSMGTMEEID